MIHLQIVNDPLIFKTHPELTTIWPETSSKLMQESVQDFFDFYEQDNSELFDLGKIYLIKQDNTVVGITGLLVIHPEETMVYSHQYNHQNLEHIHLRWHGIIPEHRQQNIAIESLKLVLIESQKLYPKALSIIERVPNSPNGQLSKIFFEKIGFKDFGEPDTFEGSPYEWQPMIANIEDVLNYSSQPMRKPKIK